MAGWNVLDVMLFMSLNWKSIGNWSESFRVCIEFICTHFHTVRKIATRMIYYYISIVYWNTFSSAYFVDLCQVPNNISSQNVHMSELCRLAGHPYNWIERALTVEAKESGFVSRLGKKFNQLKKLLLLWFTSNQFIVLK